MSNELKIEGISIKRLEVVPKNIPDDMYLIAYIGSDEFPATREQMQITAAHLHEACDTEDILILPHSVKLFVAKRVTTGDEENSLFIGFLGNKDSWFEEESKAEFEEMMTVATDVATEALLHQEVIDRLHYKKVMSEIHKAEFGEEDGGE